MWNSSGNFPGKNTNDTGNFCTIVNTFTDSNLWRTVIWRLNDSCRPASDISASFIGPGCSDLADTWISVTLIILSYPSTVKRVSLLTRSTGCRPIFLSFDPSMVRLIMRCNLAWINETKNTHYNYCGCSKGKKGRGFAKSSMACGLQEDKAQ